MGRTRLLLELVYIKLNDVLARLSLIEDKENRIMALADDLKAGIKALDDETNAVAARIDALVARLSASSLTDAEKADVLAALTAESDRLKTLGTDPNNPVPTPPTPGPAQAKPHPKKTP